MAGSKYAYVRNFELPDPLLPGTFVLLRIDGHAFHRFSDEHQFSKPNDERALGLMDHAARAVMDEFKDIVLAFGESDEFSFLFRKTTTLYNRRESKILTTMTSLFTASYVMSWRDYLPETPLRYAPSFDGRIVLYPGVREIRDYFAWRQADTHINNLYNTAFWALVQQGRHSPAEAHTTLRGTVSAQKHELLFSRFGVNYNQLPARFRKGSVLVREEVGESGKTSGAPGGVDEKPTPDSDADGLSDAVVDGVPPDVVEPAATEPQGSGVGKARNLKKTKIRTVVRVLHCDIIGDEFWTARPALLED